MGQLTAVVPESRWVAGFANLDTIPLNFLEVTFAYDACIHSMYHRFMTDEDILNETDPSWSSLLSIAHPHIFCQCTPPNHSLWQQRTAEVQRGEMLKNCVLPKYLSTLKVLQNPAKSVLLCIHAVIYPGPKNISYFDADLKKQ